MNKIFHYGQDRLSVATALSIAQGSCETRFSQETIQKITASQQAVIAISEGDKVVYGVNTGFGPLCTTIISKEQTRKLQENILRSHSVGVGDRVPEKVVRLMLITKLHALSQGYSGIAFSTLERINWFLQNDLLPVVPSQGSVGASGDLAPLAHLFLPLIGLGKVVQKGIEYDSLETLVKFGMEPIHLGPKEGLALINGTQFILAFATQAVGRLHSCLEVADIIGAMSLEGVLGSAAPFNEKIHKIRPYAGSEHVAFRLRTLLKGSEMVESHANCGRVQDPYSIRCMPQVHGASRTAWRHLMDQVEIELNSVTDNPIILSRDETISGGNFHGQPLALPIDYSSLASSELGNISDRRTYLLLGGDIEGLPKLLMRNTGINSGFMIPQYTSAALVSENKSLCFPPSADSIPTSLGQEDHVSMGSISGRRVNQIIDNLENILAVELICAAQAFDYRKPMKSGPVLDACHEVIRGKIDHAEEDRIFADDILKARELIVTNELVKTSYQSADLKNINLKGPHYDLFSIS